MVDVIRLQWKEPWFKSVAGWRVPGPDGEPKDYLFSKQQLRSVPRRVRDPELKQKFSALIKGTGFERWWNQMAPDRTHEGAAERLFRLEVGKRHWDIPWELLLIPLAETDPSPRTCIVRTPKARGGTAPIRFGETLRTLVLLGEDSSRDFPPLDLHAERRVIEEAWNQLEANVQKCVEPPRFEGAFSGTLPAFLGEYKPHVLIFTGHGTATPRPALLFRGDERVTATGLVRLMKEAEHHPLYVFLSACETARKDGYSTGLEIAPAYPKLCDALLEAGVLAVLAMQDPIREVSARVLSEELFRWLALGYPLELALPRARVPLLVTPPSGSHRMDWATPVVWSTGAAAGTRLKWNSEAPRLAQLQVVGRQILRATLAAPTQVESVPTDLQREQGERWVENRKTWVQGDSREAEDLFVWVVTLQTIQRQTDRYVVAIQLRTPDSPAEGLQSWASDVLEWFTAEEVPRRISDVLHAMRKKPIEGWKRLCDSEGVFIAVSDAPTGSEPSWFWEPLEEEDILVAIMSPGPWRQTEGWEGDRIGSMDVEQDVDRAIGAAPRLARALAALNLPMRRSYLTLRGEYRPETAPGPSSVLDWSEAPNVLVETEAGPLLGATTRDRALATATEAERLQAELDCLEILARPQWLSPKLLEERIRHLRTAYEIGKHHLSDEVKVSLASAAANDAFELIKHYRHHRNPHGVLRVSRLLGSLVEILPRNAPIFFAWACARLGDGSAAEAWLRNVSPRISNLDRAWVHGLRAELRKARGERDEALAEIERAISACEIEVEDGDNPQLARRRLRAYLQDRARIRQYLQRRIEDAANEYEQLLDDWADDPDAAIDVAVVKRNLAEAIWDQARQEGGRVELQRARDLLDEARELVETRERHASIPVYSEILYEQANFALEDKDHARAGRLLEEAGRAASTGGHFMIAAIAANKAFWVEIDFRDGEFDLHEWSKLEDDLSLYDHGWAVRSLWTSRVRAARHLERAGDRQGALKRLLSNYKEFDQHPSFDQGSDRDRIAQTFAGLAALGQPGNEYWREFLEQHDWARRYVAETDPHVIWSRVD